MSAINHKPDHDSLMALEALLKIRSESFVESGQNQTASPRHQRRSSTSAEAFAETRIQNARRAPPGSNQSRGRRTQIVLPPTTFVPHEANTNTASPRFSHTQNGTLPGYPLHFNAHGQYTQSLALRTMSQCRFLNLVGQQEVVASPIINSHADKMADSSIKQASPMTGTVARSIALPALGLDSPGTRQRRKAPTSFADDAIAASSDTAVDAAAERDALIRKDEVEAALRSKPQRGRKRDNLNALERLELTRTRNREHAKCTRVRKKARYQELLDYERKYEEFEKSQLLNRQRQECVRNFFAARETMLRAMSSWDGEDSFSVKASSGRNTEMSEGFNHESRTTSPENDGIDLKHSHRAVSFSQLHHDNDANNCDESVSVEETSSTQSKMGSDIVSLGPILKCTKDFTFRYFCTTATSGAVASSGLYGETMIKGMAAMKMFDNKLVTRIENQFGVNVIQSLSYSLKGSSNSIVFNKDDIGFVEVEVTIQDEQGRHVVVISAVVKFEFAFDSTEVISVGWWTSEDFFQERIPRHESQARSSSSLSESLGCQMSYPSVVSLDPNREHDEPGRCEIPVESPGPGMNI